MNNLNIFLSITFLIILSLLFGCNKKEENAKTNDAKDSLEAQQKVMKLLLDMKKEQVINVELNKIYCKTMIKLVEEKLSSLHASGNSDSDYSQEELQQIKLIFEKVIKKEELEVKITPSVYKIVEKYSIRTDFNLDSKLEELEIKSYSTKGRLINDLNEIIRKENQVAKLIEVNQKEMDALKIVKDCLNKVVRNILM